MDQDKLFEIVGRIYDAALDQSLWPETLSRIADFFDAASCHFLVHDVMTNTPSMHLGRCDPTLMDEYFRYYGERNPWILPFLKLPTGTVIEADRLVPRDELVRTEFFNEHLRRRQVAHCLGVLLSNTPTMISSVTIYRAAKSGSFDEASAAAARALVPHFQHAINLHTRLRLQERRAEIALETLDLLPYGVMLLDATGNVHHLNQPALSMINQHDGISIVRGEIHTSLERDRAAIRKTVAAAVSTSPSDLKPAAISISRPSGLRSFQILISPLRAKRAPLFGAATPQAVAFLTDPEQGAKSASDSLQRVYGLTSKEAALASLLVEGRNLNEAAEILRVGLETVRTHLKHVLSKTDTRSQSDLIRTVLTSAAGLPVNASR